MSWVSDALESVGGVIGSVAPTIATALGGPLAGAAVQEIAAALGLSKEAGEKDVAAALRLATPEQLLALKQADQAFAVKMEELGIDLERIAAGDRDSARKREIETKDWTPKILAALVVSGYITVQWYILSHVIDPAMREIVLRSFGTLDAALTMVLSYYFGSSASSRAKDQAIAMTTGKKP
jgi:hypothetical protein